MLPPSDKSYLALPLLHIFEARIDYKLSALYVCLCASLSLIFILDVHHHHSLKHSTTIFPPSRLAAISKASRAFSRGKLCFTSGFTSMTPALISSKACVNLYRQTNNRPYTWPHVTCSCVPTLTLAPSISLGPLESRGRQNHFDEPWKPFKPHKYCAIYSSG